MDGKSDTNTDKRLATFYSPSPKGFIYYSLDILTEKTISSLLIPNSLERITSIDEEVWTQNPGWIFQSLHLQIRLWFIR